MLSSLTQYGIYAYAETFEKNMKTNIQIRERYVTNLPSKYC